MITPKRESRLVPTERNSSTESAPTGHTLALGAPAAYALARLSVPYSNVFGFIILATQMLPGIAIAIPLFLLISYLGLIDSVLTLGVVYLSFNLPIVIWILRGFFLSIPVGIEKAAAVDGAGPLRTLWYVILPISIPPMGAAAVFAFIEAWNEFFFALILTRQSAQTVPLAIAISGAPRVAANGCNLMFMPTLRPRRQSPPTSCAFLANQTVIYK